MLFPVNLLGRAKADHGARAVVYSRPFLRQVTSTYSLNKLEQNPGFTLETFRLIL